MDFGKIGGDIAGGAANALLGIIMHVPLTVWLIIVGATILFGILMRYLTNWKVDLFIVIVVGGLLTIVYYRQHWIDQGYNEALARVTAAEKKVSDYKATNALIQQCWRRNGDLPILWDSSQGICVRKDGSKL